jgi:hypothetical protein
VISSFGVRLDQLAQAFCTGQEVLAPEIDKNNQQNGLDPKEAIIMECQ